MAVTSAQIQELYIGYFGRPADQAGLNYWLAATNATNSTVTLNDIRSSFAQQTEYTTEYPSTQTRAQTVTEIYQNLFGRTPAENEVGYWTFTSANTPVQNLIQAFLESASASDRAIVDAKAAFAQTLTDTYGSSSNGSDGISAIRTSYQGAITAAAQEQAGANPPAYITSLNTAISNATDDLSFNGNTFNAFDKTSGNLTISANEAVPATLALNGANLTSFTLAHDFGDATTAGAVAFGGNADQNLTSLTLNLTHNAVTEANVGDNVSVDLSTLTSLTSLNAAGSNVDLSFTGAIPTTLTNITLGSGDDTLTVTTGAYNATTPAKAIAIAAGAGNDVITANVDAANVQINAGAGSDTINLNILAATGTGTAPNSVPGAAQGNHGAEIALGADSVQDIVNINPANGNGVGNIQFFSADGSDALKASQLSAATIKVTEFTSADHLNLAATAATAFSSTADYTGAELQNFNAATTLLAKLSAAATLLNNDTDATAMHFEFNGNTYVYADAGTAGTFGQGDTLVELTGVTGLTAANFGATA